MNRCLVLITGVSDHAYGLDELCKYQTFYRRMVAKYGREHIYEIDYQKIMDKYAFAFKSLMDPVRLVMMPKGWRAEKYVETELQRYASLYDEVDVISHSLGSWMVLKANVEINNLYLIASPVGWFSPMARTFVRLNIGKPKIKPKHLFWIYSQGDLISKKAPELKGKWRMGADTARLIETGTVHDLGKYLIKLNSRYPGIFK